MKEIKLTQGKSTLVDDDDFDYLNQFKWQAFKSRNIYNARRGCRINGKDKKILMHREIMNTPAGMQVDHIDHNELNNQKCNLRNCTNQQNHMNMRLHKNNPSNYIGVHYSYGKYIVAQIRINGRNVHLGHFKTEKEAAIAYDKMALQYFGEFANLNFKYNDK